MKDDWIVQVELKSGDLRMVTYLPISFRKKALKEGMRISLKDETQDTIWTITKMYAINSYRNVNRFWPVGGL